MDKDNLRSSHGQDLREGQRQQNNRRGVSELKGQRDGTEDRSESSDPSYEAERERNEEQPPRDEETRLNRSEIQEGPKGGRPAEDRRSA